MPNCNWQQDRETLLMSLLTVLVARLGVAAGSCSFQRAEELLAADGVRAAEAAARLLS
jgi:hypothetical protein